MSLVGQSNLILVANIPLNFTNEDLLEYFAAYGNITDCTVIKSEEGFKTFGFVSFETVEQADECMKNSPHQIKGKNVNVLMKKTGEKIEQANS